MCRRASLGNIRIPCQTAPHRNVFETEPYHEIERRPAVRGTEHAGDMSGRANKVLDRRGTEAYYEDVLFRVAALLAA